MKGYIYKYENKINHKVYIGQTINLKYRQRSHKTRSKYMNSKFYYAIRKYGWDNFSFSVIDMIESSNTATVIETLDSLEIKYISIYDSYKNGYNSTIGGHTHRGDRYSEEFKEKQRNKIVSKETRKKLSDNAKRRNFGAYRELTTKKRNAGIRKALAKKVVQINKEGKIINEFPTEKDAAKFIQDNFAQDKKWSGISHGLFRHLNNITKKRFYYGFEWKFKANV